MNTKKLLIHGLVSLISLILGFVVLMATGDNNTMMLFLIWMTLLDILWKIDE